jgi:hypothetical protein
MKNIHPRILSGFLALVLVTLACGLPSASPTPGTVVIYITATSQPPSPPLETVTAPAPASTLPPVITHILYPAESQSAAGTFIDVDSRGTAPERRAPYGDSYKLNRFERPFTASVMDYLPDVDILHFSLSDDVNWVYVSIEVIGFNPQTNTLTADYGVEFDMDRDGFGDYLVWAKPPYTTSWTTDGVTVFTDTNNDAGGISPERSEAPFSGNGYDTTIFAAGQGADPDLAWVRLDPLMPTRIQFAVKRSLPGGSFLWGVWADLGLKDPAKFNYNDAFTEDQAGSPEKSETQFYPVKAVHSVDNTCREAVGFRPTGYEPMLCPRVEPTHEPQQPPQAGCVNPGQYHDAASCTAAGCAWVRDPTVIIAVIYHCVHP